MVVTKDKPEHITIDPNFKPLPKYGHYSELDAGFAQLKPMIDSGVDAMWAPELSLEEFRKLWLSDSPPPPGCPKEGEDVTTETQRMPVRDGANIEIKVYRAKEKSSSSSSTPALMLRVHGGGWVVGGHCTEHSENLLVAGRTNTVIVSVDYRM